MASFGHLSDGVDIGDLQRKKGVAGVLRELRGGDVGFYQHASLVGPGTIDAAHCLDALGRIRPDQDPVRFHRILDCLPFAKELRVRHDVEPEVRPLPTQRSPKPARCTDGDGGLLRDHQVPGGVTGHVPGRAFDRQQVGLAVRLGRRPDADEGDLGVRHNLR